MFGNCNFVEARAIVCISIRRRKLIKPPHAEVVTLKVKKCKPKGLNLKVLNS